MKPEDLARRRRLEAQIAEINKERPAPIPVAMAMTDGDYRFTPDGPGDEPAPGKGVKRAAFEGSYLHTSPGRYQVPPSYLMIRGDVNSPGPEMKPGFVNVITNGNPPVELPPASGNTSGRRRALAEWLVSPENPLTARVIVNRIWHHHFGRGIVATLDNFGKMGELPSNPELLDWLAMEFVKRGWSIKEMHRLLMTSQAYQMASQFDDRENLAKDPDNRLCWRFRMQRLDAEILRDSILAMSGTLNMEMFGKPVFPKLQAEFLAQTKEGIWQAQEDGPGVWRRSIYIYRKRGLPFPLLDVFDLPNQNISCGARNVSTVPTQALALMNDEFIVRQAQLFANRLEEAEPRNLEKQVELGYRLALSRPLDLGHVAIESAQFLQLDGQAIAHVGTRLSIVAGAGLGARGLAAAGVEHLSRRLFAGFTVSDRRLLGAHPRPFRAHSSLGCAGRRLRWTHPKLLLRASSRASRLSTRIMTTSVRAAPHARFTTDVVGDVTSVYIWIGSEFMKPPKPNSVFIVAPAVNKSGAVSPAARAIARSTPVTRPGKAVGSTILNITRQRGAPRAKADSRKAPGTSRRTTSAERVTTGSIKSANAKAPL